MCKLMSGVAVFDPLPKEKKLMTAKLPAKKTAP